MAAAAHSSSFTPTPQQQYTSYMTSGRQSPYVDRQPAAPQQTGQYTSTQYTPQYTQSPSPQAGQYGQSYGQGAGYNQGYSSSGGRQFRGGGRCGGFPVRAMRGGGRGYTPGYTPAYNGPAVQAFGAAQADGYNQYSGQYSQPQSNDTCGKCGRSTHNNMLECTANTKNCNICNRRGHFAVCCRTANRNRAGFTNGPQRGSSY